MDTSNFKKLNFKNLANLIIDKNYKDSHNFIYLNEYTSSVSYQVCYLCNICDFKLTISFWQEEEDIDFKFYYDNSKNFLYYIGESRILNDDKFDLHSCNEYIIKKLIE